MLFWQWFFFCKSCFAVDANVYSCMSLRLRCLPGCIPGYGTWKVLFVLAHLCEVKNTDGGLMEKPVTTFTLCSVEWRGCSFYVSGSKGAWRHQCLWRISEITFSLLQTSLEKEHASLKCNLFQPLRQQRFAAPSYRLLSKNHSIILKLKKLIFVCLVFKTLKQIHLSVSRLKQAELQGFSLGPNLALWDVLQIHSEEHSRCQVLMPHWHSLVLPRVLSESSPEKSSCVSVVYSEHGTFLFSECPAGFGT